MTSPIALAEAQARLLAISGPLELENIPVRESVGRYLAAAIIAQRTQPPADLSAMDGYAIFGSAPWQVIGESKCGTPFGSAVASGQAVRISTGALMPEGADRVLLQEDAERSGDLVTLQGEMPPLGKHIRRSGFDFTSGVPLMDTGTWIGPAQIALMLAAGHNSVNVRRRPIVTFIDSGDELTADPANCQPYQIPASNSAMLAAMASQLPVDINILGPIPDRLQSLINAFRESENSDLIVTSGGVSVGDHDLIRPALEAWGAEIDFWKVSIKPGKPLLVARRDHQIILGLPGNPVSNFATAFLFMVPLLRHLSGSKFPLPRRSMSRAGSDLSATGPRREFLRAVENGSDVIPVGEQDSSALRALANANALIERPANSAEVKAGTNVPIYLLQNG